MSNPYSRTREYISLVAGCLFSALFITVGYLSVFVPHFWGNDPGGGRAFGFFLLTLILCVISWAVWVDARD